MEVAAAGVESCTPGAAGAVETERKSGSLRSAAAFRAPAAEKKRAAKDLKKTQPRTVIPRLQGAKPFGTAGSDKSKGGTVDMSELMRQAGPAQGSGD